MAKKPGKTTTKQRKTRAHTPEKAFVAALSAPVGKPSALLDTRVIYCGDCLEQLKQLSGACVDLIYIDPPFNSNRNYDPRKFWARRRRSARLRTDTPALRRTSTTCAPGAWNGSDANLLLLIAHEPI
jgi:16S rRNA G966 N2-methylase RsmD